MRFFVEQCWQLPRNMMIGVVSLYQHTLSPDHGPLRHLHPYGYCRHEPTCSAYAKLLLRQHGAVIGTLLAAKRVLGCTPWTKPSLEKMRALASR